MARSQPTRDPRRLTFHEANNEMLKHRRMMRAALILESEMSDLVKEGLFIAGEADIEAPTFTEGGSPVRAGHIDLPLKGMTGWMPEILAEKFSQAWEAAETGVFPPGVSDPDRVQRAAARYPDGIPLSPDDPNRRFWPKPLDEVIAANHSTMQNASQPPRVSIFQAAKHRIARWWS
jgi:hypothetical protein